jgi:hypothetical protein
MQYEWVAMPRCGIEGQAMWGEDPVKALEKLGTINM